MSAKRTLRCISRPHAATRLVFLGQLYMVIIDHIYKNQLHASTCRLEKFYMVEYWKICFYFPFLSFPILYHVKFGICFPRLLPFLMSFGKSRAHCRKEEIVFYTRNLENLDRPNFVSASRTLYPQMHLTSSKFQPEISKMNFKKIQTSPIFTNARDS